MAGEFPFHLGSFPLFLLAAAMGIVTIALGYVKRAAAPKLTKATIALALPMLALAAGELTWRKPEMRKLAVMVDLSPSTRTAKFRDRDYIKLRLMELLGRDAGYELVTFGGAGSATTQPSLASAKLEDIATERTVFTPPANATAVLLFSDGRFELPSDVTGLPPIYAAVDANLVDPPDAAVRTLETSGGNVLAEVVNNGTTARQLTFTPKIGEPVAVGKGVVSIARPVSSDSVTTVSAQIDARDPWPENDALTMAVRPAASLQRWWIGEVAPNISWVVRDPKSLPANLAAYMGAAVIVLDNVAADAIPVSSQQLLTQYVRDLGGSLLIIGGNHSFAAGGYAGSAIEAMAPLASTPPKPVTQWMLVIDGSGSMSDTVSGQATRFQTAASAVTRVLDKLPRNDSVSIGSFARELTWWSSGKSVDETKGLSLPPAGIAPQGPTNLQAALEQIASSGGADLQKQVLILTDGQATIDDASALAQRLQKANVHLHVLALGNGSAMTALREMAQKTGGSVVEEIDPGRWASGAQKLAQGAMSDGLGHSTLTLKATSDMPGVKLEAVKLWNRTWLKDSATVLASASDEGVELPMIARWQVGSGTVLAMGFTAEPALAEQLARSIARPPKDPRFAVDWQTGPELKVSVEAREAGKYLNDLELKLLLRGEQEASESAPAIVIPQTGPGKYELSIPAPRFPVFASVRKGEHVIDQMPLAGRYPREFDGLGNDLRRIRELTTSTGGRVINPDDTSRIDFHWPTRPISLAPYLAIVGAALIGVGLVKWRGR